MVSNNGVLQEMSSLAGGGAAWTVTGQPHQILFQLGPKPPPSDYSFAKKY